MKVKNCQQCRKQIINEAKTEFAKHEYAFFADCAFSMAVYATVAVLTAQIRRGRSKEYIQKLFDDIVMIYDTPEIFGKPIYLTDLRKTLETEYGIDFNRINVNIEDEKSFITSL